LIDQPAKAVVAGLEHPRRSLALHAHRAIAVANPASAKSAIWSRPDARRRRADNCQGWHSVLGLSMARVAGHDGVWVRRPGLAFAPAPRRRPGLRPPAGDYPADRAVRDVRLPRDRGRWWPAAGAVVARARAGRRQED